MTHTRRCMPITLTSDDGTRFWLLDKKLHREGGPAVMRPDGEEVWYLHGERHRVGGPAVSTPNGVERWYQHDQLHREDGPAMIWSDGEQRWYLQGNYYDSFEKWLAALDPDDKTRTWLLLKWGNR